MQPLTRRRLMQCSAAAYISAASLRIVGAAKPGDEAEPGDRPFQSPDVKVLTPRARVPLSFIIDDSTVLVNLAHFCIPHFAEAWPDRYPQDWRSLPREIPDAFVREFGEWCAAHGVKGKYSIVPNPACVGWVDRVLPGWSQKELDQSLNLVRDLMLPNWDIHPEMVTHTWVIDTKTGRPYPQRSGYYIENAGWSQDKSADVLADYIAYALRILKNAGLPCEGHTTPGGFGNQNRANLSIATGKACRAVYGTEIPHYFRHLFTDERSVAPRVEYAAGLDTNDPRCIVSIIGCTGDWFGGWDGLKPGSVDQFITVDLNAGRMVEVIERGDEPAIMVCHWPGIYFNGQKVGFNIFKQVVRRVHEKYDNLIWMKLSQIARYWAAKELTTIEHREGLMRLTAPFATELFTVEFPARDDRKPRLTAVGEPVALREVRSVRQLDGGTWTRRDRKIAACFYLPKGVSEIRLT